MVCCVGLYRHTLWHLFFESLAADELTLGGFQHMKRLILAAFICACVSSSARADLTFSQWASGPADKRALYAAGVLETVGVYAEVLGFVESWKQCLSKEKLTY